MKRYVFTILALLPLLANAQDKCTETGKAEQDQIQRDFSRKLPAKGDKQAEAAWAKDLHAALEASAKRAEDCTRASKRAAGPAFMAQEQACAVKASQQADELAKKYRGKTLSAQEQAERRKEEDRLLEERMSCLKGSKR
ncbi:MAG: hypothetical protein RL748_1376 [Pseudomonadota bacterium]